MRFITLLSTPLHYYLCLSTRDPSLSIKLNIWKFKLAKRFVDETRYGEPGGTAIQTEANDGFSDNNPESLFHDDEIRNLGGGDIPRSITLDKPGEQESGVFARYGASTIALPPRDAPRDASSLKGRNIHIHYRCAPRFSRPRACPMRARLSCLARASRPWKFIGKTRWDRSRIHQLDDLARRAEI